jgi:hypothetical protein
VLDNFTQRQQAIKETLRKEFIGTPWPQKADDFLTGYYAWVDKVDQWIIDGIESGKANWKKYRELRNEVEGLFNRQIVFDRARSDRAREKITQLTQELRDKQAASGQKKGKKPKPQAQEGEWSKPMSKAKMMRVLRLDSYPTFNAFIKRQGVKKINRQTFRIRLDTLDEKSRSKLAGA